jgi:hypothetical protein
MSLMWLIKPYVILCPLCGLKKLYGKINSIFSFQITNLPGSGF